MRGTMRMPGILEHTRSLGYEVVTGTELFGRGIGETAADIRRRMAGRPVYLCFDMDFFDPSCAPGVCAPTWGGATAREGLTLLGGLSGLDFVARSEEHTSELKPLMRITYADFCLKKKQK